MTEDHRICHANAEQRRAEYRAALAEARSQIDADTIIGSRLREWVQPGVRRKTYRRDEIETLIAAADALAASRRNP